MLDRVKLALSISANTYDTELTTWIQAAIGDLGIAGVEGETVTTSSTDALIINAIITYCGRQFDLNIVGCKVYPQGYPAVLSHMNDLVGTNMIADIDG